MFQSRGDALWSYFELTGNIWNWSHPMAYIGHFCRGDSPKYLMVMVGDEDNEDDGGGAGGAPHCLHSFLAGGISQRC